MNQVIFQKLNFLVSTSKKITKRKKTASIKQFPLTVMEDLFKNAFHLDGKTAFIDRNI